jgi:hypothetical protein
MIQVVVCSRQSGRLKNRQHAEEPIMRCHSYAQVDLFTRLSPEDGDDGLSVMAYLMLKTGLRTIEVSRARIEHLQEQGAGEKWKLWAHGKGRESADESV